MSRVYTQEFMGRLAQHMAVGATVACYVPSPEAGGRQLHMEKLRAVLRRLPDTMRETGCFERLPPLTPRPDIVSFRRIH